MSIVLPHNWRPRDYQRPLWTHMESQVDAGKAARAVAIMHRRAGKDLLAINWCACQAAERVGVYWHLFPEYNQGRKVIWEGCTREGRSFLSAFPDELIEAKNNTEMRLTLKNGSTYQVVGTDNIDRLVGANPVGCVFSEYSLQDPRAWDYVRPILAENGGWALFIYTPRGHNHGYKLLKMAQGNPEWFAQVITVEDSQAVSREIIESERRSGMPEELIQQEFYCSFDAPLVGAYYSKQMSAAISEKRICEVPYDPILPVYTAWDLGVSDATAIWFFQVYGMEYRIIDYYEAEGEGLPHYAKVLSEKPYVYAGHNAPHDIQVRELGTGRTRLETAKQLGIKFKVISQHRIEDGIEAVRNILSQCWFDAKRCERGIEALKQYRKQQIKQKSSQFSTDSNADEQKKEIYSDTPLHDWTSHAADGFRYFAMSQKHRSARAGKRQENAINEYSVLS